MVFPPADIAILDNGKPPASVIALRHSPELPLRFGVVVDKSNSQRRNELYRFVVEATSLFLNSVLATKDDRLFMEAFDTIPLPPTQWMNAEQLRPLGTDVTPSGGSALYDATKIVCEERMRAEASAPARRVLLLLSDGEDNNSRTKLEDAIACAKKAGVVIFAISTAEGVTKWRAHVEEVDQGDRRLCFR